MHKRLPIGKTNFRMIREQDYYFVDKSLLIKEVLDSWEEVLLLPRPRRFGKTVNMQMLYYFFHKAEEDAADLFRGLAVAQEPEVMAHQGKYPTLFLSLKGIRGDSWETVYPKLQRLVADLCHEKSFLAPSLNPLERRVFEKLMMAESDQAALGGSLRDLVIWLSRHHQHPVMLLIDEYDTPILEAYSHCYYDRMISFMRCWLGEGLKLEKEPGALYKAVVTGIMRVAKESLFSGLNNPSVFPLQRIGPFEDKFGFTQEEVEQLLTDYGLEETLKEVNDWYNGYQFGNTTIYNPWSIIYYIDSQPNPAASYWVNTSQNELIYEALKKPTQLLRDQLETLLGGGQIKQVVTDAAVLREGARARDIWSFMLAAGYLTPRGSEMGPRGPEYKLAIPNREVRCIFSETVERWLERVWQSEQVGDLLEALVEGRWQSFEELLQRCVVNMLSYHDLAADKPAEAVIQAFVLGLLANLAHLYQIRSNREEGQGRADIVMNPFDKTRRGLVIEFKAITQDDDLDHALAEALAQIEEKQYAAGLEADGVATVAKLAIVLQQKTVATRAG